MYKFLISNYENKIFDSSLFEMAIEHHVKKNDFDTVKQFINKTNWKNEINYNQIKFTAIYLCTTYKKPSYELFDLLFSQIQHKNLKYHSFEISAQEAKLYDLQETIKNALNNNKITFIKKLLKNHQESDLNDFTLVECIKIKQNKLALEVYNSNCNEKKFNNLVKKCIEYKNTDFLLFLSGKKNIFRSVNEFIDKNINYHICIQIMEINSERTDKFVADNLCTNSYEKIIRILLEKKRNKLAEKWIEKSKNLDIKSSINTNQFKQKINLYKLSLKGLILYKNIIHGKKNIHDKSVISDYDFINNLNHKISRAIRLNKKNYINYIVKIFELKNIFINSDIINDYYKNISLKNIKLKMELPPISIEQKIDICLNNNKNQFLINILIEHQWNEIEPILTAKKLPEESKRILHYYMSSNLDRKQDTKKIKI